jgi:hypothetical protein
MGVRVPGGQLAGALGDVPRALVGGDPGVVRLRALLAVEEPGAGEGEERRHVVGGPLRHRGLQQIARPVDPGRILLVLTEEGPSRLDGRLGEHFRGCGDRERDGQQEERKSHGAQVISEPGRKVQ